MTPAGSQVNDISTNTKEHPPVNKYSRTDTKALPPDHHKAGLRPNNHTQKNMVLLSGSGFLRILGLHCCSPKPGRRLS
jgi:hypothetical protein